MKFGRMFILQDGEIAVRLDDAIRGLLGRVSEELREILLVDDAEMTRRLYPTAYPDDEALEGNYQEMVHDQLLMHRLNALDTFQSSIEAEQISLETADAWMDTINQVRLVLGTQLDVSEDDAVIDEDDPDAHSRVIYQLLSHVLEELTAARAQSL